MPQEEMQVYSKLKWSYKNVGLPRDNKTSVNNTFDGFNKERPNYIDPRQH